MSLHDDKKAHRLRLPQFIIAGAPRSGTSWLYEVLDRHPCIEMARPRRPEPKFFLVDDEYEKGLSYYSRRWFSEIDTEKAAGEKSANYLESETAALRIAASLPLVRLIFCLREPAARALSNYRWTRMNGLEDLEPIDAIEHESEREQLYDQHQKYSRPYSYFSRGLYAQHLRPYLREFPRSQILILRFEDVVVHPDEAITRVHEFLGMPKRPHDALGLGPVNSLDDDIVDDDEVLRLLRERYVNPNAELSELLGPQFPMWEEGS